MSRIQTLLLVAALVLLVPLTTLAQKTDTTGQKQAVRAAFDSIVTANTYSLTLEQGTLRGNGVQWLVEQGQDAHHFMIGERHGTAEIPVLSGALYERLRPAGYEYAALEIGPFAARHVDEEVEEGGFEALEEFITGYDAAPIAFLDWREEARLAARISEAGGTIWGLDQEFSSSLPMHLDALAEQAKTKAERTAVKKCVPECETSGPRSKTISATRAPRPFAN